MTANRTFLAARAKAQGLADIHARLAEGARLTEDDGLRLIADGSTSPEELLRVTRE